MAADEPPDIEIILPPWMESWRRLYEQQPPEWDLRLIYPKHALIYVRPRGSQVWFAQIAPIVRPPRDDA